jgi:drug/metabolite transporter (DMT)-like permease
VQQLAAGLAFLILSFLIPQPPVNWNTRGVGALLYLVFFGSIVGYTSFVYTLKTLPVALIALHNYVNPVVAAVLGWLVYREPFGRGEIAAMAIIFLGVAIVNRYSFSPGGAPARRLAIPSEEPWPP